MDLFFVLVFPVISLHSEQWQFSLIRDGTWNRVTSQLRLFSVTLGFQRLSWLLLVLLFSFCSTFYGQARLPGSNTLWSKIRVSCVIRAPRVSKETMMGLYQNIESFLVISLIPLPPEGLIHTYQPDDPVYVIVCIILCPNLLVDSITFEAELKFCHILKDPGPDSFLFLDLSVHHSPLPYHFLLSVPPFAFSQTYQASYYFRAFIHFTPFVTNMYQKMK